MTLWQSIAGMIEIKVTSAALLDTVQCINSENIPVFSLQFQDALSCILRVYRKDLANIARICEKRGDRITVCRNLGIYWRISKLRQRPILATGLVAAFLFVSWIPTRVLFVQIEDNEQLPKKMILEAANQAGICFGANRKEVRSEQMKNALLSAIPQLQWAGVNTYGCTAVVSVRERTEPVSEESRIGVSSIIADCDGVISSFAATKGTVLCTVGEVVQKGQILISGYTDCGLTICAVQAEGEVYAQTEHRLNAVMPSDQAVRSQKNTVKHGYSLLIGKNRINLWNCSGIWDSTCGRIYQEKYLTLPGGYQLPVAFCVEEIWTGKIEQKQRDSESVEAELCSQAEQYLIGHMLAGKIDALDYSVTAATNCYQFTGYYHCTQMIGKTHWEEVGDLYGKTDGTNR